MKRFENQVVIVTGATRGIGKGIAHRFAQEGASLALVGRDEELLQKAAKEFGVKAISIHADVRKEHDMENMVKKTLDHFGKIDILCHNAGIYPHARLENMTLKEWKQVIDTNLTGTFLAVKACIPIMKSQKKGRIVINSSISGPKTGLPGFAHYTASKAGITGFIRTAAIELAKYQITINAVEPGNILTETLLALGPKHVENMLQPIPLGRLGSVEDVAGAIAFLASDDASFITGQSLIIDGGQTLPESHFEEY